MIDFKSLRLFFKVCSDSVNSVTTANLNINAQISLLITFYKRQDYT